MSEPPPPKERAVSVRVALREEIAFVFRTALELSQRLGIRERDVATHLEHLAKTVSAQGSKLEIKPAACLACGFSFGPAAGRKAAGDDRARFTTPGKCPKCRSERITPAAYRAPTAAPKPSG